jgi:hypothetical protein
MLNDRTVTLQEPAKGMLFKVGSMEIELASWKYLSVSFWGLRNTFSGKKIPQSTFRVFHQNGFSQGLVL